MEVVIKLSKSAFIAALIQLLVAAQVLAMPEKIKEMEFTELMARSLRHELGNEQVTVAGPLTLVVGSLQANLDRIYSFCLRNEADCGVERARYIQGVVQVIKAQNAPIDENAIRLVIRTSEYMKRAQSSLGDNGPVLQFRPLVGELNVVAVLDTPRAVRPLDDRDLKKLGITQNQLFETAVRNLRTQLKPLSESAKPTVSGQIGNISGSFYDVGRVAVSADWSGLAGAQNGTLLITLPTTDRVLYISESSPSAIDALRTLARSVAEKSPNPLSSAVLKWTAHGWESVP